MPNISEIPPIPRRVLPVIYVIDNSSDMRSSIQQVNEGIQAAINKYREDFGARQANMHLKMNVLQCGETPRWMHQGGLIGVENFNFTPMRAGGKLNMGAALKELNSKLSENSFLPNTSGYFSPFIIFVCDSHSADDYMLPLKELVNNSWFEKSNKICLLSKPTVDAQMMILIAGDIKSVARMDDYRDIACIL